MNGHGRDLCRCGAVVAQCRCMNCGGIERVVCDQCPKCPKPMTNDRLVELYKGSRLNWGGMYSRAEMHEALAEIERLNNELRRLGAEAQKTYALEIHDHDQPGWSRCANAWAGIRGIEAARMAKLWAEEHDLGTVRIVCEQDGEVIDG